MKDKLYDMSKEELKKLPLKKLRIFLSIKESLVYKAFQEVIKELHFKNIMINPVLWIADEWFCPDGVCGLAAPFYLFHPLLIKMEKEETNYVEGNTFNRCKKIIRHEFGHIIDNVYSIKKRRDRILLFGKSSVPYPRSYTFRPYSKNYVRNLEDGYAQGHSVEDFAETFAVWLSPKSDWKNKYASWPAIKKLEYMDSLMSELVAIRPNIKSVKACYKLSEMDTILSAYYKNKRKRMGVEDSFWDVVLKKISTQKNIYDQNDTRSIGQFVKTHKNDIRKTVGAATGYPKYLVDRMLDDLEKRSVILNLMKIKLDEPEDLSYYLIEKAKSYIDQGRHHISL